MAGEFAAKENLLICPAAAACGEGAGQPLKPAVNRRAGPAATKGLLQLALSPSSHTDFQFRPCWASNLRARAGA